MGIDRERPARRQVDRVLGIGLDDVDRHLEHGEHLAPARDRGLRLVDNLAELGDRVEHQRDEEHERDEVAEVQAPLLRVERAHHGDAGDRDRAEEVAEGEHRVKYQAASIWARYTWSVRSRRRRRDRLCNP